MSYLSEVLADAPAFYYPMRASDVSGTSVLDRSGNARHATATAGLTFGTDLFTPCSGFDGASARDITTPYATDHTAGGTLEAWVRPDNPQLGATSEILSKIGYYAVTVTDFPISLRAGSAATPRFALLIDGGSDFSADQTLTQGADFANQGLYHLVGAYSSTQVPYLMVNGTVVATGTAQSIASSGRAWRIGRAPFEQSGGIGQNYYKGKLGHVAFYPSFLSQARALVHWNEGRRMGVTY